jgi:hypothetical protein
MGKRDDRFIILLDVDKVFSGDELSVVQTAQKDGTAGAPA